MQMHFFMRLSVSVAFTHTLIKIQRAAAEKVRMGNDWLVFHTTNAWSCAFWKTNRAKIKKKEEDRNPQVTNAVSRNMLTTKMLNKWSNILTARSRKDSEKQQKNAFFKHNVIMVCRWCSNYNLKLFKCSHLSARW